MIFYTKSNDLLTTGFSIMACKCKFHNEFRLFRDSTCFNPFSVNFFQEKVVKLDIEKQ